MPDKRPHSGLKNARRNLRRFGQLSERFNMQKVRARFMAFVSRFMRKIETVCNQ